MDEKISRLGLGTWVFGGWPWNAASPVESEKVIEYILGRGTNLVDTAPLYGFGSVEELLGRILKRSGLRNKTILSTKCGLIWDPSNPRKIIKNHSSKIIVKEIEKSLKRLQTEFIDLYQIHAPDHKTPIAESMETLSLLKKEGKIRFIGLSNFERSQVKEALEYGPVDFVQPRYHYFDRSTEKELLPFCLENNIGVVSYSTLCKGVLTGKFNLKNRPNDPVRHPSRDPSFEKENYEQWVRELPRLKEEAAKEGLTLTRWAIRWVLRRAEITSCLVGARTLKQAKENFGQLPQ